MENASKALIIAGAILISILIVGLGVIIYNNVSDVASSGTLDAQQISSHNSPFESYFGDYVSGSNVKALFTQVQANNNAAAANGEDTGNKITIVKGTKDANNTITAASANAWKSSDIKTGKTYTVGVYVTGTNPSDYNDTATIGSSAYWKNGFIKTIVVVENS